MRQFKLTAEHVEALAGVYLSPHYDRPVATPDFHRECWARYCSEHPACATAAPRGHAKSTALTHDYVLANVLLRSEEYVIIVSASEEMAVEHLGDIAQELRDNDELIVHFGIKGLIQDQKTDIIVACKDGHQFRILARGAEQKIRGRKWHGKRPGLIVCDDLEDDEQVESRDRRRKFARWFFRACKQALRRGGKIRVHGTILHVDSLLMHLMKNRAWNSKLYKAHNALQDFSNILWPEAFPKQDLQTKRQEFLDEGDSAGYAQEYLNDPQDYEDRYLRDEQFIPMTEADKECYKDHYVGVDLAISKQDSASRTSFTVGGKSANNLVHIVDERVGRLDALGIVEEFFFISECWSPKAFFIEKGHIWQAMKPIILKEMQTRDHWFNIVEIVRMKDKKASGRACQKRMKAGGVRFNTEASWFKEYKEECLLFTGDSEAILDDQPDSTFTLFLGMEKMGDVAEEDEYEEEAEDLEELIALRMRMIGGGQSRVTGY